MKTQEQEIVNNVKFLLESAIAETGANLATSAEEIALFVASRSGHLALVVAEPGFDIALIAERDNVALFAGLSAASNARKADLRLVGIIQASLLFGAKLLVAVA